MRNLHCDHIDRYLLLHTLSTIIIFTFVHEIQFKSIQSYDEELCIRGE